MHHEHVCIENLPYGAAIFSSNEAIILPELNLVV